MSLNIYGLLKVPICGDTICVIKTYIPALRSKISFIDIAAIGNSSSYGDSLLV